MGAKRSLLLRTFMLMVGSVALYNTLCGAIADEILFLLSCVLLFAITGSVANQPNSGGRIWLKT
ncbi:MAG: hypothetical protein WCL57_12960 [Chloroflexota bacterium]|jgi:hypothetical protein|nr:hypothetical protein [Chloroflexota bacterium]